MTSADTDVVNLADARAQRAAPAPATVGTDPDTVAPGRVRSGRARARQLRRRGHTGQPGVRPTPAAPDPATSTAGVVDADELAERAATIARIVAAMGELTPEDRHRLALLLPAPRDRAA